MQAGKSETLNEAVPESLKNILLVMASGGYLVPPQNDGERTEQQGQIWSATWERLENFLPGLMPELFPGAGKEAPPPKQEAEETESSEKAASPAVAEAQAA